MSQLSKGMILSAESLNNLTTLINRLNNTIEENKAVQDAWNDILNTATDENAKNIADIVEAIIARQTFFIGKGTNVDK